MDISALNRTEYIVTVPFSDGVTVDIRHISREELRTLFGKATRQTFVNHQKREEFDPGQADLLLGRAAVVGWDGFTDGDKPFPCTPENTDKLMSSYTAFARFVNDTCIDLDALIMAEKEAERKNSQGT